MDNGYIVLEKTWHRLITDVKQTKTGCQQTWNRHKKDMKNT